MRILVISDLPQFVTGGAEKQAENLISAWISAGHEVSCFGRRMRGREVRIGGHVVPVRRIRTMQRCGRLLRGLSYFVSLSWLLLRYRRRFDVVYTRFLGEAAFTLSLLKETGVLNVIVITTPAGSGSGLDIRLFDGLPFRKAIIRLLDKQCNAINLIAPTMNIQLRKAGFSGFNFSFIPNGVEIFTPLPDHDRPSKFMIAVGRLSPEKGYDVLVDALCQIKDLLVPNLVRVIGGGPELANLKKRAVDVGVAHAIDWMGQLPNEVVRDQLKLASIFLLPSRFEGMSNAGLEAMESGLPVIVTSCGGLDTFVEPTMGWVVPPGDVDALAAAMREALLADPGTLVSMGERARALVVHEFELTRVAQRYLALFQSLLDVKEART